MSLEVLRQDIEGKRAAQATIRHFRRWSEQQRQAYGENLHDRVHSLFKCLLATKETDTFQIRGAHSVPEEGTSILSSGILTLIGPGREHFSRTVIVEGLGPLVVRDFTSVDTTNNEETLFELAAASEEPTIDDGGPIGAYVEAYPDVLLEAYPAIGDATPQALQGLEETHGKLQSICDLAHISLPR